MKRSWETLGCLALVAVVAGGCAKRVETEPAQASRSGPDPAIFYPLAVGNRWSYEARFLGETREQSVELVRKDENGFFVDTTGNGLLADAYGVRDEKRYLLRAPLTRGAQWTNVVSVSAVEKYQVLDVGVPCESRAGAFVGCVRVASRSRVDPKTELINELTFAPNVGIVRIEVFVESGGQRIPQTLLTLREYALAPAPGNEGSR